MATVVNFDDVRKAIVSILQSSTTAYGSGSTGSTPDGSNAMFVSNEEIQDAVLYTDAEICTLIANTPQSPFQSTFAQTSTALNTGSFGGVNLPARNGMVIKVTGLNGQATAEVDNYDFTDNKVNSIGHGFVTGQAVTLVKLTSDGGTQPTELSFGTTYYVIFRTVDAFSLAYSPYEAQNDIEIDFTVGDAETGTSGYAPNYVEQYKGRNADEIKEVNMFPARFGVNTASNSVVPWFFIEGNVLYSTALYSKVIYTDYTKTNAPQAPQNFRNALVAGAVARLLKDGADESVLGYYNQLFAQYMQQIAAGATVLPEFAGYAIAGKG